jgi:hypothetical protein
MSTIKQLVERIIQTDFSAISPLRDFLAEDSNYRMQLYRFDNAIGRYLTDIEHWKENLPNIQSVNADELLNDRTSEFFDTVREIAVRSITTLPEGSTIVQLRGRDRFRLNNINDRFIDSIKQIFWRELYDLQTVIQTFYNYFKLNDSSISTQSDERGMEETFS